MQLTEQQQKVQNIFASLTTKCWEDNSFTKELTANPVTTIEKFTGEKLDLYGKKLIAVDQTDNNKIYFNIPAEPDLDNLELTDEQLEIVAGGSSPLCIYGGLFLIGVAIGLNAD